MIYMTSFHCNMEKQNSDLLYLLQFYVQHLSCQYHNWFILYYSVQFSSVAQFSSVQSLSGVWLFATPWIAAHQASLSITNSLTSLRLTSIESVRPSTHLILCYPLLLLPPIPPAFNLSQHQGLFQWISSSHQVAKVLELQLQHYSFQWIFRTDFL